MIIRVLREAHEQPNYGLNRTSPQFCSLGHFEHGDGDGAAHRASRGLTLYRSS
jgi:hypothetical protein